MATEDLLTAGAVAALLHVSDETVRRWAEDKRLPHVLLPSGHRRYRRSDIDKILTGVDAITEVEAS